MTAPDVTLSDVTPGDEPGQWISLAAFGFSKYERPKAQEVPAWQ